MTSLFAMNLIQPFHLNWQLIEIGWDVDWLKSGKCTDKNELLNMTLVFLPLSISTFLLLFRFVLMQFSTMFSIFLSLFPHFPLSQCFCLCSQMPADCCSSCWDCPNLRVNYQLLLLLLLLLPSLWFNISHLVSCSTRGGSFILSSLANAAGTIFPPPPANKRSFECDYLFQQSAWRSLTFAASVLKTFRFCQFGVKHVEWMHSRTWALKLFPHHC